MLGLYLIAELITANIVEPVVIGRHVGLSPLAFVAAGTFWWLVWGPVGLLLASPLTTVFVVLGEFFPPVEFATLLFGDRPPLTPEQEYYHRLLAGDAETAAEALEKDAGESSRLAIVETVVVPALCIGAKDLRERRITAERGEELAETIHEVLDYLSPGSPAGMAPDAILIPGHGPIDTASGELVAQILSEQSGMTCAAIHASSGLLALSSLKAGEEKEPAIIILFSVGGVSPAQIKHMARRAHALFPKARVIVYDGEAVLDLQSSDVSDRVVACPTLTQVETLLKLEKASSTRAQG